MEINCNIVIRLFAVFVVLLFFGAVALAVVLNAIGQRVTASDLHQLGNPPFLLTSLLPLLEPTHKVLEIAKLESEQEAKFPGYRQIGF